MMQGAGANTDQWKDGADKYQESAAYFTKHGCGIPIPDPPHITETWQDKSVREECSYAYSSTWNLSKTMTQLFAK